MSEMSSTIRKFIGEFTFLSNFYPSPVKFEGQTFPTVEHAFQAAKTQDQAERDIILRCHNPSRAKRKGRQVCLRPDWEEVKENVMLGLLRQKFKGRALRNELLITGDAQLIEGNNWGDTYWGVCNGQGKNRLGILLMRVRDEVLPSTECAE